MTDFPRISFGIIVLNGEPFTRYNLRALYPFAHQLIVVEGAVPSAANVATRDGHSRDGTLEILHEFKATEDPEDKLEIVTCDGFWSEKDEMSQAYSDRVTGDYLWQVDIDEFYQPDDMHAVLDLLRDDPEITAVSFKMKTFWGSPRYVTDGWYLKSGAEIYHRLFKWDVGYRYVTHRPPTIVTSNGSDTRQIKWIDGHSLAHQGIYLYHYSLLFPKQVFDKCDYYSRAEWAQRNGAMEWAEKCFMQLQRPFRVHNVYQFPSWLEQFDGTHPPVINTLWHDAVSKRIDITIRQHEDIEQLLDSMLYRWKRAVIKRLYYLYAGIRKMWHLFKRVSHYEGRAPFHR